MLKMEFLVLVHYQASNLRKNFQTEHTNPKKQPSYKIKNLLRGSFTPFWGEERYGNWRQGSGRLRRRANFFCVKDASITKKCVTLQKYHSWRGGQARFSKNSIFSPYKRHKRFLIERKTSFSTNNNAYAKTFSQLNAVAAWSNDMLGCDAEGA